MTVFHYFVKLKVDENQITKHKKNYKGKCHITKQKLKRQKLCKKLRLKSRFKKYSYVTIL